MDFKSLVLELDPREPCGWLNDVGGTAPCLEFGKNTERGTKLCTVAMDAYFTMAHEFASFPVFPHFRMAKCFDRVLYHVSLLMFQTASDLPSSLVCLGRLPNAKRREDLFADNGRSPKVCTRVVGSAC